MTPAGKALRPPVILLMGPTASGKTGLAVELVERFPMEIVSVDSALVYRGMDIGTAKPDAETLRRAPHRLIDIRDPAEAYSAAEFVEDARDCIEAIQGQGGIPLLCGGTMLYFRAITQGLSTLPQADPAVRAAIEAEARARGWQALHDELARIDPQAAGRIHPNDPQRIQRALEVYRITGRSLSELSQRNPPAALPYRFESIVVAPTERAVLHARIEQRFDQMLADGLVEEVEHLYRRGDLSPEMPSMRCVGYRQIWDYLAGQSTLAEARLKGIYATRQLAKRQFTWLRANQPRPWFDLDKTTEKTQALQKIQRLMDEISAKS